MVSRKAKPVTHLEVCETRCDQCLFSPDRIVGKKRMQQILNTCQEEDRHFTCHKASIVNRDVCCRGFWDTQRHSTFMQIAARLGRVKFIPVPEEA